ncbi:TPA: heavy metal resistance protein CzcA [Candidatus Bathyarchaeota archaeon]|nr:heavy metal resistance protein CzcA [Candidatus Bathyarchaeota archaeon]
MNVTVSSAFGRGCLSAKNRIIVDKREKPSGIPRLLRELGMTVDFRMLEIGDYILPGYAIERKEIRDFLRSIFSRRVFNQAQMLSEVYENPILIIEGDISTVLENKIIPAAFWGALSTLAFDYELSIFFTPDTVQTPNLIYTLRRKRSLGFKGSLVKAKPKFEDAENMQIQIVASLPGVGPKLADRLLSEFKSVRRVFTATAAELSVIKGISRKTSYKIKRILDAPYRPSVKPTKQIKLDEE